MSPLGCSCLLIGLVAAGATGCLSPSMGLLSPIEQSIVFQPSGPPPEDWSPAGLPHEDIWFTSEEGLKLHGRYCPVDNPRAVVLFAHGNAGNLADRTMLLKTWSKQLDVTIMAFDYRGYGRSEGKPSEQGLFADARSARRTLAKRAGVPESEIVLYGRSIGGAVMIDLAAKDGARALIVESSFTSLPEVANSKFPYTPFGRLMKNRFTSIEKIENYHGPLLLAHGKQDRLIPFELGKELFAKANDPKKFVALPDAGHNWSPPQDYLLTVSQFIDSL